MPAIIFKCGGKCKECCWGTNIPCIIALETRALKQHHSPQATPWEQNQTHVSWALQNIRYLRKLNILKYQKCCRSALWVVGPVRASHPYKCPHQAVQAAEMPCNHHGPIMAECILSYVWSPHCDMSLHLKQVQCTTIFPLIKCTAPKGECRVSLTSLNETHFQAFMTNSIPLNFTSPNLCSLGFET